MAPIAQRLGVYAGFIKLEHTFFSLPVIVAGAVIGAGGWPSARLLLLIVLAAAGARTMAMGLNRLIDAGIDARNPRTQQRELPRRAMRRGEAWAITLAAGAVYLASAAAIGPVCLEWSWLPAVLFVAYPYLKRFTSFAHLGLGLAWSMGPVAGWLGATQSLSRFDEIVWLGLFSLWWVAGFDVIYATMDERFDREAGLHSLPATVGKRVALLIAAGMHATAFACLAILFVQRAQTAEAAAWLFAVGGLFIWQHAVAARNPAFAFFQLNSVMGFLVLALVHGGL